MLRLAFIAAMTAAVAAAGPTTIAQSKITAGNGAQLATGEITIAASVPFLAADGTWVDTTALVVHVINGAFSVQLEPNDTSTPSAGYSVTWNLETGKQRTEYWVVATSGGTLGLSSVVRSTVPVPSNVTIPPGQLAQDGANTGQPLCWLGASWGPGSCGAGGWVVNTVGCGSSPTFDLSLGNVQVLNLTCNVTSSGVANLTSNAVVIFRICQQGTYSFTWPGAVTGGVNAQVQTAGKCAIQWFQSIDGVHLQPIGIGVVNQ